MFGDGFFGSWWYVSLRVGKCKRFTCVGLVLWCVGDGDGDGDLVVYGASFDLGGGQW